jgi:preprotein translocase subunit SecG
VEVGKCCDVALRAERQEGPQMAAKLGHSTEADRNETEADRLDRNYGELLQELRVAETGVQILFAFMLSIAFQQRFQTLDTVQRTIYVTTLVFCTLSIALLVAPVAYHRLVFRQGMKAELVATANKLALAGTSCLLLAVLGGVLLIFDYVVGRAFAIVATGLLALVFLTLWLVLPLWRRRVEESRQEKSSGLPENRASSSPASR